MDMQSRRQLRLMEGRNNPFQTLIALFVTALFFMMFQASILKNLQRSQHILLNSGSEQHNKGKYSRFDALAMKQSELLRNVNPKFAQKLKKEIGIKVNGTVLRGVMKVQRKFYIPSDTGQFTCMSGNQSISWVAVNDDYCDCDDGSDEPGTSACKNGRFYCEPEHAFLPSSRVNDGLCDCCDGSDEWKGVTLPPDLNLPDSKTLPRVPCRDVCLDYEHSKLAELNLVREGASAKPPYLDAGLQHAGGNFGPRGEFYKLSLECFAFKSPGYIYEICPFANATQSGKEVWLIGRNGKLVGDDGGSYKLMMENGKGDHCPDGKKRKTIVTFQCGPSDVIKHVSEKETCVYGAKFETPAACPDLDALDRT